ncbi:origin recognition complex subunit 6 [Vigna unguiculata]|uniref:Origin recognition complex subunit 6 n=1 Tax=Vigna unguiculata TaxID=3917 RepID=A0A4D6LPM4_VIGUN|nr:origin recognition complex subunit 6 [Vigna unguiculata]
MDVSELAKNLDLSDSKLIVRKAAEIRVSAMCSLIPPVIGVSDVAKSLICLEIAATGSVFSSTDSLRTTIDVRESAIQFGCIRTIPFVCDGLKLYKDRFVSSLPTSRPLQVLISRVAFYLCAKKHKLKVDKLKLIELCGTSESEFSSVSGYLLDVLPSKRKAEDGGYLSDDGPELSCYKKRKQMETRDYEKWKSSVVASNQQNKKEAPCKRTKQSRLNFMKKSSATRELEAM